MAEATSAAPSATSVSPTSATTVQPTSATNAVVDLKTAASDQVVKEVSTTTPDPLRSIKHKVKIDGKEVEVGYDDLIRDYQLGKASQQRMNEAAAVRKQAEELIALAKSDPRKLLSHPNINADLRAFAETILAEHVQEQLLTPEQKEKRDMKKKLEQYENQEKEQKTNAEKAEYDRLYEHYNQEYSNQIITALDSSGLPKTPDTVKRMASYMKQALDKGINATTEQIVQLVKQDYLADVKALLGNATPESLIAMLGEEVAGKVVKSQLSKVKTVGQKPVIKPVPAKLGERVDVAPKKHLSREEFKRILDERTGRV